jgi:MFS family permease
VYPSVRDPESSPLLERGWLAALRGRGTVARNVVLLGLTSLFTDVSSEALTAVLPLYLMLELRMTPLQFGILDGLYQGASALVRVVSGLVADAARRYKRVAFAGYGLSALCKPALLGVGAAWAPIAAVLLLDRVGKGIRSAPRDALIALASPPARLGEAFGVHRALDAVGAALGPVLAFAVLAAAPGAYDAVFVASFAAALLGLAILGLFVEEAASERSERGPSRRRAEPDAAEPAGGEAAGALGIARLRSALAIAPFRALVLAGALLGLATVSDALVYLLLQRRGAVSATAFPLLFVGTAAVYLLLARSAGRLADRWGRHRVFLAGHGLALALYGLLLLADLPFAGIAACVALLGAYYAATDGVLAALASSVLGREQLSTGLAVVSTATALSRLLASSLFGALWSWRGPNEALAVFGAALVAAMLAGGALLGARRPWPARGEA